MGRVVICGSARSAIQHAVEQLLDSVLEDESNEWARKIEQAKPSDGA